MAYFYIHKSILVFASLFVSIIVTVILICLICHTKWQEFVASVKRCRLLLWGGLRRIFELRGEEFFVNTQTHLIFVTNITNYIHGEKVVRWRNFSIPCMTIVGKLKISPHAKKFWEILPQFTRFHVEKNWAQKYIRGEAIPGK